MVTFFRRMITARRLLAPWLPVLIVTGAMSVIAAPARADALVVVRVQTRSGPVVDGRVTLTPRGEGHTFTCETTDGACRIDSVPGGQYVVTFAPHDGPPGPAQQAMIPPSGTVSLFVSPGHR